MRGPSNTCPALPRLPPALHLRCLDEAGRRTQRLLGTLPGLRARLERVPVPAGRPDAQGARLRARGRL